MRLWHLLTLDVLSIARSTAQTTSGDSIETVVLPTSSGFLNISSISGTRPTNLDPSSINALLATAVPQSVLVAIATNSPAAISSIYSQFEAGATPAWFAALPSDVQTYLVPVTTVPQASASEIIASLTRHGTATNTASYTPVPMPMNSTMVRNGTMMGSATNDGNGTMVRTGRTGMATGQSASTTRRLSTSGMALSTTMAGSTITGTSSTTAAMTRTSASSMMTSETAAAQTTAAGNAAPSLSASWRASGFVGVLAMFGLLLFL